MQISAPVIDAHHHLWRYRPEEFDWINDAMSVLRRDFLPQELGQLMHAIGIGGTVAVQARQTLEETRWLCCLTGEELPIRGVVGWAPIASPEFPSILEELRSLPRLVGLRHIVQSEPAGFLDAPAWNEGIRRLTAIGLTYDLLIVQEQMEETLRFVDRHPNQSFVLDHIAKPKITSGRLEPWRTYLRELSRRPNVVCKLSGVVTEADWHFWTAESLRPWIDCAVEFFRPARLMVGSDWPVCLLASSYERWWSLLQEYFASFSSGEQQAVFGGTAIEYYRLQRQS